MAETQSEGPRVIDEFKRGWPIVATAAYGTAVGCSAVSAYPLPYFMQPLHDAFGWTRGEIAFAAGLGSMSMALSVPIWGRLADRYGVRRVIPISIVMIAASVLATTLTGGNLVAFYACYMLAAFLGGATTFSCYTRAVTGQFDKGRGMAMGFSMTGTGIMAFAAPLLLPPLIGAYGWQAGYLAIGAACAVALIPALLFLKDPAGSHAERRDALPGFTLREAFKTRQFWAMFAAGVLTTAVVTGTQLHGLALLSDMGMSKASAAETMSLYGVSMIVSRIAVGLVLDRIHAPKVALVIYCLPAIGLAALGFGHLPLAVLGMMSVGMIAAAEGDLLGFLTSRFFGLKSYSEIFGWLVSSFAAGGMVGASVVGLIYDHTQSYTTWLFGSAITSLVVGCLLGTLGRYRYVAPK